MTLYPDGVVLRESMKYDLHGNVVASCITKGTGSGAKSLVTSNTYDAQGRITLCSTTLNGSPLSYVEYGYDALGMLTDKVYGNGVEETLKYDIRGQLTGQEAVKDSETVFSSVLRYADSFNSSCSPSWAGNISSWTWTQDGQDQRTYVFGYDGLDRLVSTAQYKNATLEDKYGEDLSYDRNGNITSITRRNGSTTPSVTSYTYSGNKRNEWEYDSNGNVTSANPDDNYPVTVEYNILNLPATVTLDDDYSYSNFYLADGTKLSVIDNYNTEGILCYGPFRYDMNNGTVIDISAPGGRAVPSGSGYAMHYFTVDHLGSTRLVTDASGSVREQFDYLPFGELCQNSGLAVASQAKTDYLYTGKELQQFFGINWYDSFARFQTTSGVFSSPDPLCEKYYSVSPYAYCADNPVNLVDLDGKKTRIYVQTKGIGHAFVTTGEGSQTRVYTYGRYGALRPICGMTSGRFTPRGEGVLLIKEGETAKKYLSEVLEKGSFSVFEITNGDDNATDSYYNDLFKSGDSVSDSSKESFYDDNARVVDTYDLFTNNCVIVSIKGINACKSLVDSYEFVPVCFSIDLKKQSITNNSIVVVENPEDFVKMLLKQLTVDE